ncbi:MAG: rhomboid family intramembrane serine protease [Akkermansiaceae bacterium]|nr:rhomboid family intramembrane serine protease [Akkermansiaceae bacterium]
MIGLLVGVIYGGMIWGVLPTRGFVSWEAHLAGLLAGLWLGRSHAVNR